MEQVTLDIDSQQQQQQEDKEKSFEMANDSSWKKKLPAFKNAVADLLAADPYAGLAIVSHRATFAGFLDKLPAPLNQQYNCRCCEEFFDDYSGVVVLNNDGSVKSPFYTPELAPEGMEEAYAYIAQAVAAGTVVDFFKQNVRRKPTKGDPRWSHWGINFNVMIKGVAEQSTGRNLLEEMDTISNGFIPNTALLCARAVRLLQPHAENSNPVRSHLSMFNVYSQAYSAVRMAKSESGVVHQRNALARLVIDYKTLYHFRGSAAGTLLSALSNCEVDSFEEKEALKEYFKHIDPTLYKRAVAEASQEQVIKSEKWLTENGYASSLRLTFATEKDLTALPVQWTSTDQAKPQESDDDEDGDIFGVLKKAKGQDERKAINELPKLERQIGEVTVTRFLKDILPSAVRISVFSESLTDSNVCSGVIQVNRESKPLYKLAEKTTQYGMLPTMFSVRPQQNTNHMVRAMWGIKKALLDVKKIIPFPSEDVPNVTEQMADRYLLLVDGIDNNIQELGLRPTYFPDSLVLEVQQHRAVMENLIGIKGYKKLPEGEIPLQAIMIGPKGHAHFIVETATEKLIMRLGDMY